MTDKRSGLQASAPGGRRNAVIAFNGSRVTPPNDALTLAINLVGAIGDQAARDQACWNAGYRYAARAYFELGLEAGRTAAERAQAQRWAPIAEHVDRIAGSPSYAELQQRRAEPGNLWRYRDGQAAKPDAFTAGMLRRGAYKGGPVDWETSRPLARPGVAA